MRFNKTIEMLEAKKAVLQAQINNVNIIDKELAARIKNSYWAYYREYDEAIKILKRHSKNNQKRINFKQ